MAAALVAVFVGEAEVEKAEVEGSGGMRRGAVEMI